MPYPSEVDAVAAVPSGVTPEAFKNHESSVRAALVSIRTAIGDTFHPISAVTQAEYDLLTPDEDTLYVILPSSGGGEITASHKTTGGSGFGSFTSQQTAEITVTAGRLVMVAAGASHETVGNAAVKPTVSGLGATWVEVDSVAFGGGDRFQVALYRTVIPSTITGQITVAASSAMGVLMWTVVEFNGTKTTGTQGADAVVQAVPSETGSTLGTSASVTLSAFAHTDNATFGVLMHGGSSGSVAPGTGFLELGEVSDGRTMQSMWQAGNDTSVDWSWAGNQASGAIAVELAAAGT